MNKLKLIPLLILMIISSSKIFSQGDYCFTGDEIKEIRRLIVDYETQVELTSILTSENDSLQSEVNTLKKKNNLSELKYEAQKTKTKALGAKIENRDAVIEDKDEKLKRRGWIIVGEAVVIVTLIILL